MSLAGLNVSPPAFNPLSYLEECRHRWSHKWDKDRAACRLLPGQPAACSCCSLLTAPSDRLQSPVTNHDVIPTAAFCWVTLLWASVMRAEQTDGWLMWLIHLSCLQWERLACLLPQLPVRACMFESICHFLLQASHSPAWVCLWHFSSPEQMLLKTTRGTSPGSARI